ncbi:hypothetical protein R1flu_009239 [Riccia fluitans]|uniref:Integrase catalytic domain-containing protein n=1 Tax=Riccia fluitans TaxID=41844 RepID=A0ABD1Z1J0_9MARC
MHSKPTRGHYALKNIVKKIMNAGYWWPTMYKDAYAYIKKCDGCQRVDKPTATTHWPFNPILPLAPFEKWEIDFVGPIQPTTKKTRRRYILIAIDYATKWVEAEATKKDDTVTIAAFLHKNIITRFDCPLELVSDRGTHFLNNTIEALIEYFHIKHKKTTPYHPRANGLTEKSNELLCRILNKVTINHSYDWDTKLDAALWAFRNNEKITTKQTPFFLAYGMHPIMPIEFETPTYRVLVQDRLPMEESQLLRL